MKRISNKVVKLLQEHRLTLALAESMTCGLAAHQLSSVKGTSDVLKGAIVCYSPEVKHELLEVPRQVIEKWTCESQQVTNELAERLSSLIEADVCAAITGLAAPGGSETKTKPVGTVFYAVYFRQKLYKHKARFYGSPLEIKTKACKVLFEFILKIVPDATA